MKKIFSKDVIKHIKNVDERLINKTVKLLINLKKNNKVILAGNGASASISSHVSNDLTKAAGVKAINFNEANLITCFSNDYGYENWVSNALKFYSSPGDILILISSSGQSKNIINAANLSKKFKLKLITLSGFSFKNKLKSKGLVNFYVNSNNYNTIEILHLFILLNIVENLIANKR